MSPASVAAAVAHLFFFFKNEKRKERDIHMTQKKETDARTGSVDEKKRLCAIWAVRHDVTFFGQRLACDTKTRRRHTHTHTHARARASLEKTNARLQETMYVVGNFVDPSRVVKKFASQRFTPTQS